MKTLLLLRHAKSSWDNADLADFDRPLNKRGLQAAPFIGRLIRKNQLKINSIISSPAKRARQTAIFVKEATRINSEIEFDERIYDASLQQLLQIVSEINDKAESVMLVGHNPSFEGLLKCLTGEIHSMPTAALAVIDLKIDEWSEAPAGSGSLRILLRPKEEMKSFDAN